MPTKTKKPSKSKKSADPISSILMTVKKEREGYAEHFATVYAPVMDGFLKRHEKLLDIVLSKDEPLCVTLVQFCPEMLNALPSAEVSKYKDELLAVLRLSEIAKSTNADDYQLSYHAEQVIRTGKAFAQAMFLYRSGYEKVTFDFNGGGDEGHVDNIALLSEAEDDGDVPFPNGFEAHQWVYDMMPSGFGNDEPYYNDGVVRILLKDLTFDLECNMEVRNQEWQETSGVLYNGLHIPEPD